MPDAARDAADPGRAVVAAWSRSAGGSTSFASAIVPGPPVVTPTRFAGCAAPVIECATGRTVVPASA
ncbi:hypothetical protein [Actinomadura sp. 3N407]|uniref:hypothetical protein n=1 Tax=Actinomadura sp. 3N407 TaxID=3457423 RepID=UPI003FCC72A4